MNILVYGLGAIGTTFATFLKGSGNTVYGKTNKLNFPLNLYVEGIWGEHKAKLDGVFTDINELKDKNLDLIIVAVKSYDTETAIKDIKKVISENTIVLLAQNGYGNYEIATSILGKDRVLLSRVIFGAKVLEIGKVEITVNADDVIIGNPDNAVSFEKIQNVINVISKTPIPVSYSPDVYKILWDKILYNSALNPLGAILECSYGDLAENPETRDIMNNIFKEIFIVAKANNIKLRWNSVDDYIKHFYTKLIPPTREHYPSMYYDIKTGKRTEIDALNGAILKLAKKVNISVPYNETIVKLLKFKEKQNLLKI